MQAIISFVNEGGDSIRYVAPSEMPSSTAGAADTSLCMCLQLRRRTVQSHDSHTCTSTLATTTERRARTRTSSSSSRGALYTSSASPPLESTNLAL